jgi:ADP-heptose:LPS heptosyltransferase
LRVFVLKPDAIGDFVLATGAVHRIARAWGESSLTLAVRADVAPFAQEEFPEARVVPLPLREKRRVVNLTVVNVLNCLPAWIALAGMRVEAAVCLRSMRTYLQTALFLTPGAKRRIACENRLAEGERFRRPRVENFVRSCFRPELLAYPLPGSWPTELEANRLVVSELLGEHIDPREILPRLRARPPARDGGWLLCPFSSTRGKDYPDEKWVEVLSLVASDRGGAPLFLAAGPSQQDRLRSLHRLLDSAGVTGCTLLPEGSLGDLAQAVSSACLVLTVDTAAAHMACAAGRPAVIVSAGQHPGVYAPYTTNGLQDWIMPPPGLARGAWKSSITAGLVAERIRGVLSKRP